MSSDFNALVEKYKKKQPADKFGIDRSGTVTVQSPSSTFQPSPSNTKQQEEFIQLVEKYGKKESEKQSKKLTSTVNKRLESIQNKKSKEEEDDSLLDFFQKGSFEDGFDWYDIPTAILGTAADAGLNVVKGGVGLVEGVVDLGGYAVSGAADLVGADSFSQRLKSVLQESQTDQLTKGAEDYLNQYSLLGRTSDAIMQGVGQIGAVMATGGIGAAGGLGAAGTTALTSGLMGLSGMGSGMGEAYKDGATDGEAVAYGAMAGASDAVWEMVFGGLGKAINAVGFSKGLSSLDDIAAKGISKFINSPAGKNIAEAIVKSGFEGLEEVGAGFTQAIAKELTYKSEEEFSEILKDENLLEQFIVGAFTSSIAQSPSVHHANKAGVDYVTGQTQNEQAVIKKEIENRIAEAEKKNGKKLTGKEKSAIEAQVEKDLEKGYISTDTIEEVLGGEDYKKYKETVDSENALEEKRKALQDEFNTLNKMKQGDMTGEQIDRRVELKEELAKLKETIESTKKNSPLESLKKTLSESVSGMVIGDRLIESYNERSRRGQAFEADLTKYDDKQKAVVQKAVESGILNNTNRAHEFVDMVAKISADKGVLFDFTNNAKLKESGFAVEGKTVNGYVTKDGITINMDSSASRRYVVGHEITHVLEGTELYTELQNTIFEYAKTKGDYQSRFDALSKMYESIEGADVNAELTADLVGEYLFNDSDFINNLSTNNRNVFEKIYDEIKYMLKVATAGSKEARELERVKRAFDKAYREGAQKNTADGGAKYALSKDVDGNVFVDVTEDILDTNNGESIARTIQKVIAERFHNLIDVHGQKIQINKTTNDEFRRSNSSSGVLAGSTQAYTDKLRTIANADEILHAARNWIGEAIKHQRKDDIVEFARANVMYRVGENGYIADVLVGTRKNGAAVLYDLVNIYEKKITEAPVTMASDDRSQRRQDASAKQMLPQTSPDVKKQYSLSDSNGRQLTNEQQEFFKDSVVRDENGNLKVMYHGTSNGGHTVFDPYGKAKYGLFGGGSYFTDSKTIAESYTKKGKGKNLQVYETYLNIKNPIDMDAAADPAAWAKAFPDADFPESGTNEQFYRAMEEYFEDNEYPRWEAQETAMYVIEDMGYDGITHIGGGRVNADGERHRVYIALQPEQIKNVDNQKPTANPDIRYSLSEDSNGKKLTEEQNEYFKDSVIRDPNGKLIPMYHGTMRGGFTVFGGRKDYWYFTNDKKYAYTFEGRKANGQLYPSTKEGIEKGYYNPQRYSVYLNVKNPFVTEDVDIIEDALYWDKSLAGKLREKGYDAIMLKDMSQVIVLNPNQIKNISNKKPTLDQDINRSLSNADEQQKTVSDPLNELRLETAPVQEDVAPVAENATVQAKTQLTEDNSIAEMFPDEQTPQTELDSLLQEQEALESQMLDMANTGDFSEFEGINARYAEVSGRIGELENEISETDSDRLNSLDDTDVPPEMDAPYQGEPNSESVPDPFMGRDMDEVAKNRKVKAYQYENPEVKPFFQEAADAMIGDLNETIRGEKIFNDDVYYESGGEKGWMGTKRQTTDDIAWLKDTYGYTYDQIRDGVNAIIEDEGKENNAVSKRIEFLLHERLVNGYKGVWGDPIPPNQEYINFLKEREINEYSKEAFDSFMTTADQYAPEEDIAPVAAPAAKTPAVETPVAEVADDIAPTYDVVGQKNVPDGQQAFLPDAAVPEKVTRKGLHQNIVENVKAKFAEKGFDFDKILKNAKNLSTFATVDNTPQRVMEKALGYKAGGVLADLTVNKVAQNETEGIKWLNSFTDRKNGVLAQISKQYNIKPGSKESAAAQMYAEGFYVGENDEIISYGNRELAMDFPDARVQRNIKGLANDPRIRKIYDDTLKAINESRARNAYPEIPRLDNYFLHFRAMEDTFSRLGLPFNPNDIRAKDLPTDLNGVTADLKPGQPYFASAKHRTGKRTSFDLLGGLERYLSSAKNQIYHIDDIQTLRALRNYVADTYGQANGLEGLDALDEEAAQQKIEQVYNSHLSTFAKFLNEEANVLAGKTALIDRGLEGIIGRRGITFLNTVNGQVGKNMVGFNISSSLTNFLPVAQTFAKTNKFDFTKAFAQTVGNKIGSVFGRNDGFMENSPVAIRRKGADTFYRTTWQKLSDPGYAFMSAVDDISTELIARTKYNEFTRKGMTSQQAHIETDKWVSRLMGDRSLGQQPQLYNSKMLGLFTKFQLEVRNQLDSQFYDTIQETKASNEDIKNGLLRNAKTAAKVGSTFFQLAVAQHLFGKAFESVAGYNPAFDMVEVLMKAFGWDDEEESEDTVLDNIEQGFFALLEDLPYTSTLTGGRIPISSALPITELIKGEDQYGSEKSRWKTIGEVAPYYLMPGGYGQVKKTVAGLDMFDDDLPIAGSYTDSGNLRFPVEDTPLNRAQAAIFGQWANENAGDYIDNKRSPLNKRQIKEFDALDIPISDYWKYQEEAKDIAKKAEKDNATDEIILKSKYLNSVNAELNDLMKEEKEISDNPNLTENEKQKRIRDIQNRFEELSREGFDSYNTVTIDGDYAKIGDRYFQWYTPEEGEPYWRKLTDDQKTKYLITKAAGDAPYATDGNVHYRLDEDGAWTKISDKQLARQNEVTKALGITPEEYWSKTETSFFSMTEGEYEYAYDNPGKYAVSKAVTNDFKEYNRFKDEINVIKDNNDSSTGITDKSLVTKYIFDDLDLDDGQKMILYRSLYSSKKDKAQYNTAIVEYLNSRDDISRKEAIAILEELGMKVDSEGRVSW